MKFPFAEFVAKWMLVSCGATLVAGNVFAQSGSLSGRVENSAGKALRDARVLLVDTEWQMAYPPLTTSGSGEFSFHALRPGVYSLTVKAPGFDERTVGSVRISPAAETALSVRLAAAAGPVVANTQALGSSLAIAAGLLEQSSRLPVPRWEAGHLLELLPGVQRNGRAPLSIYGESSSLGVLTFSGVNVRRSFPRWGSLDFTAPNLFTGQVAEAFVVTGDISGCGCAQAGFVSPTGANARHGSAYWLVQPAATAAQYWLDSSRGNPSHRRVNEFGASLGGALRKNRLFYFGSYEGFLDHSQITRIGTAPKVPLASRDPLVQKVLRLVPSNPEGRYRGWQSDGGANRTALARFDAALAIRHTLGFNLLDANNSIDNPDGSSVFGDNSTSSFHLETRTATASWRWSPTPRVTNEVRGGGVWSRFDVENSLRRDFDFIAIFKDPLFKISQPMEGLDPQSRNAGLYSFQDDLTLAPEKHTIKGGFWFQQHTLRSEGVDHGVLDSGAVPRYVITDIAEGLVSRASRRFNLASPDSGYSGAPAGGLLATKMISGYLHDAWRPAARLSFSLGMRFDWLAPAQVRRGAALIPVMSSTPSESVYDKRLPFMFASEREFYRNDLTNYALYVGLAWKPSASLPLVVRGSAHLSSLNDNLLQNMSFLALQNPFQNFDVAADLGADPVRLSAVPPIAAPSKPAEWNLPGLLALANSHGQQPRTVYGINPQLATPNIKYWNFGIEGELKKFAVDIRYLGNLLEEGARSVDRNQVMVRRGGFLDDFLKVRSDLLSGAPTSGFPLLPGGGLCANFDLRNCQPDLYARSLIQSGQAGELGRWYVSHGYDQNVYNLLGNPLAPSGINLLSHMGVARFDALQFKVSRRAGPGVTLHASYLFSKVMSNLNDYRPGAVDPYLDLGNSSIEWAPSPFNLRHAFKAAFIQELPFFNRRASTSLRGRLLSRWTVAATVTAQSGAPFSLLSGGYVTMPDGEVVTVSGLGTLTLQGDSGQNTVFTSLSGPEIQQMFGIRKAADGTVTYVTAPANAFQQPAPGSIGNLQRRMFSGPGVFNVNLGLHKSLPLGERKRAEFRAEAINLLNGVNWLVRDQVLMGADLQKNSAVFNNDITQWNAPRSLQFTVRLIF